MAACEQLIHVQVWASAKADCEGTGNVYGCAAAWASASRWATFTAEAYADAWAYAFNHCECNAKDQLEEAGSFGTAYEVRHSSAPHYAAQVRLSTIVVSAAAAVFARKFSTHLFEHVLCMTCSRIALAQVVANRLPLSSISILH